MPLVAASEARARKETGLECATSLAFVDPNQTNQRSAARYVGAVNVRPAAVCSVVGDLGAFGCAPADVVVGHRLLARARVRRRVLGRGTSSDQKCRWLSVPEWVGPEAITLEVFTVSRRGLGVPWQGSVGNFGVRSRCWRGSRSRDVVCRRRIVMSRATDR
eukprot:6214778-Pleurochrysis_carterae.AAC.2